MAVAGDGPPLGRRLPGGPPPPSLACVVAHSRRARQPVGLQPKPRDVLPSHLLRSPAGVKHRDPVHTPVHSTESAASARLSERPSAPQTDATRGPPRLLARGEPQLGVSIFVAVVFAPLRSM